MGDQRSVTGRTSQVLRDYRLKPKKSLGQNFLTDSRVLDKMVRAADIDKETGVLEVGPGIGSLTERLANVAGKVVAVEIDKRLIPILENTFASYDHVQIVIPDSKRILLDTSLNSRVNDTRLGPNTVSPPRCTMPKMRMESTGLANRETRRK